MRGIDAFFAGIDPPLPLKGLYDVLLLQANTLVSIIKIAFSVYTTVTRGCIPKWGELSYTSFGNQASVSFSSNLRQTNRSHSLLNPLHSLLVFGRSGLQPSLVQGLRPRNAPPLLATVFILPRQGVWSKVSSQRYSPKPVL